MDENPSTPTKQAPAQRTGLSQELRGTLFPLYDLLIPFPISRP